MNSSPRGRELRLGSNFKSIPSWPLISSTKKCLIPWVLRTVLLTSLECSDQCTWIRTLLLRIQSFRTPFRNGVKKKKVYHGCNGGTNTATSKWLTLNREHIHNHQGIHDVFHVCHFDVGPRGLAMAAWRFVHDLATRSTWWPPDLRLCSRHCGGFHAVQTPAVFVRCTWSLKLIQEQM